MRRALHPITPTLALFALLLGGTTPLQAAWNLSGMIEEEMLPKLMEGSKYDFSDLRGEALNKSDSVTLWDSTYRPNGPKRPFEARVAEDRKNQAWSWVFNFTVGGDGVDYFNTTVGAFASVLDARYGGLGWTIAVWGGADQAQQGVAWQECAQNQPAGRAAILQRIPGKESSEVRVQMIHYFERQCPK